MTMMVDLLRAELSELHTDAGREELRTQPEEFGIEKDVQDFILYTLYITNPVRAAQLGGGKIQDILVDPKISEAEAQLATALRQEPIGMMRTIYLPSLVDRSR